MNTVVEAFFAGRRNFEHMLIPCRNCFCIPGGVLLRLERATAEEVEGEDSCFFFAGLALVAYHTVRRKIANTP